ncbi:MAG: ribbon-helix-helix domain-containing protein [Deltaproteobacteria bacterium]|nr:MAG: ribbon-helix-helix domain-containing protein [Deltaproteobacteria bacterium]
MYDRRQETDPLTALVIRLPQADFARLKALCARTRVRQSEYLREAIADLIAKYRHLL